METERIPVTYPYTNHEGVKTIASAELVIDYKNACFSIESSCHDQAFRFQRNSHKHQMWDALAHCIQDAIKIGKTKLNLQ